MSADDLEFKEDLSRIVALSLPAIKTHQTESLNPRSDGYHSSKEDTDHKKNLIAVGGAMSADGVEDDAECQTPTSSEHKIQPMFECPPAPRKLRRASLGKRKAAELTRSVEFFNAVNGEAVEDPFRRLEWANSNNNPMRPARRVVRRRSLCHGFVVQFR